MFTQHFKMAHRPFCERPPVEHLLRDDRIAQGLARLEYLLHQETLGLLTGPTGVGKSSLIKLFLQSISRNRYRPVYLHLTHLSTSGFLKLIVQQLGEIPKLGKGRLLQQILDRARQSELATMLIIDEAQFLSTDALTQLRLLVSSALEDAPPLKILLVGQEALREVLRQSSQASLLHRITVRYHLPPLSREQTLAYIDFQLQTAQAPERLFDAEVKDLLHDYCNGIPRQINNLATACLINVASRNAQRVTPDILNQTIPELSLP